ncbi:hypothetical protein EGM51_05005 [Verrucomicrobia bacterium S94]|nr:hypothetical protein EGM51_05005 [Verrucomicrobia bacterium S94]
MKSVYILAAIICTAEISGAETSLFSKKGGFTEGNLQGQQSWLSEGGVIDFNRGGFILSSETWKSSFYGIPVDAQKNTSCSISADFGFTLNGRGSADIFSLMINERPSGLGALRGFFIRTLDSPVYKFGFKSSDNKLYLSSPVPEEKIGLGESAVSDRLTMTMIMEKGDTPADWSVEVELLNARTGESLSRLVQTGVTLDTSIYETDTWYTGFSSSRGDRDTGTRNRCVYLFSFSGDQDSKTLFLIL